MIAAVLTALCFACAGVTARRSTLFLGAVRANALRLLVALLILSAIAASSWRGMPSDLLARFAFAGAVGFGLGGYCMMRALRLLGSPRALLAVESLTAVFAGALAWIFLRDPLTPFQVLGCLVILGGVLLAGSAWQRPPSLEATFKSSRRTALRRAGSIFAVLASAAQALSLLFSREAFLIAAEDAVTVAKFEAAFVRLLGGGLVAAALLLLFYRRRTGASRSPSRLLRRGAPWHRQPLAWAVANGVAGPVLGVTAWLWAVSLMHPGIVQSVAATAPLLSVPLSRRLEPRWLGPRFFAGALLAILGITGLMIWAAGGGRPALP